MKEIIKIALIVIAMMFVVKSCGLSPNMRSSLIGQQAPEFILDTLQGSDVSFQQLRDGKPAIMFFWATWCPHCRSQLKILAQERSQIEGNGIQIILVDSNESFQAVKSYSDANNMAFDVFLDTDGKVARSYKVIGIPTFFLVDRDGIVMDVQHSLPQDYQNALLGPAL